MNSRNELVAAPSLRGDGEGVRGNGEVPPLRGRPAEGLGVTGQGVPVLGGRPSPPGRSAVRDRRAASIDPAETLRYE